MKESNLVVLKQARREPDLLRHHQVKGLFKTFRWLYGWLKNSSLEMAREQLRDDVHRLACMRLI